MTNGQINLHADFARVIDAALDALEVLGIDAQRRAETLSVGEFVSIARVLTK